MENEIKDIINKNLPAQVGDLLKARLEQAVKDAETVKGLEQALERREKDIIALNLKIEDYKKLNYTAESLKDKDEKLKERERLLELTLLKLQLEEANKRSDIVINFTNNLVRNTSFRKSVFENQNTSGYSDRNGNWISPQSDSKNIDETIYHE